NRRRRAPPAVFYADINTLIRRPTDLDSDPPAAAKVAARKAHERADRRVLRVEVHVPRKRRDVYSHCFTAPLVRPLMNSRCSAKNRTAGGMMASSVPARNT